MNITPDFILFIKNSLKKGVLVKGEEPKPKKNIEEMEEGAPICEACGTAKIMEDGEWVCPHCQGEINFMGDEVDE